MSNLPIDPVLQTAAVGAVVSLVAGSAMWYLWREDRGERYLLFWMTAGFAGALRWIIHYFALGDPMLRLPEAVVASLVLSMVLLGAYDMLPRKRWAVGRVAWGLAALFGAATLTSFFLDGLYRLFYGIVVVIAVFVVGCLVRCHREYRLSGYALAAGAFALQGVYYATGLWLWGVEVGNLVFGPMLNLVTAASFLLVAYQRSRRQLCNAEETLRRIFDTAPVPMFITRAPCGEIERFNRAAVDLAGLPAEQLLGKTAVEAGFVIDIGARQEMYDVLNTGGSIDQRETPFLRGGRERRIYALNASSIDLHDGRRFIFVLHDLTGLRRMQNELETLNASLEQQVAERTRELESFGFTISHDLRAPLRHIDGFIAILNENIGDGLEPENRRLMDTVQRAARRMGEMIDDLLHFAHLGAAPLQKRPCDLNRLVARALERLEPDTAGRDIIWRISDLPVVDADPSLLEQVLLNLLGNAIKYTAPVRPAVIEIGALHTGNGRPVLFVRDNGVGFEQRYAAKIFEVFQRLHPGNEFEGTGIGLAIVERIVRKLGGRVWAEGEPGRGATFYLTLPLAN